MSLPTISRSEKDLFIHADRIAQIIEYLNRRDRNGADFPTSNDAAVRIAAGVDGLSYGVVYYGGNGFWLNDPFTGKFRFAYIPGAFLIVDLTDCTIDGVANQARVAGTQYYIYAYFAAAEDVFASYEISTTAPAGGDPLGATVVTGWLFKNDATRNKRLIGFVKSNAAGDFWDAGARGVFFSGISSYYQRQTLNYHRHLVAINTASTVWAEPDSTQYLSATMWDDGDEPVITLTGSVQNSTAGAVVHVGVSHNGENPPYDVTPGGITCTVANQPYPFAITVTGGDFDTNLHTYRIFMKVSAGTGTLNADSNFTMGLEQ